MTEPTITYFLNKIIQKHAGGMVMGVPFKALEIADYSSLGAEMVVAGDFSTTTGWTWATTGPYAIDLTVAGSQGTMTEKAGSVEYGRMYQAITVQTGHRYIASAKFIGASSSNLVTTYPHIRIGTTAGALDIGAFYGVTFTESETIVADFVATANTIYLSLYHRSNTTDVGVSVWETCTMKEVTGGTLTVRGAIDGPKAGTTIDGGFYTLLVAGEALSRGHVVGVSSTTNGQVVKNPIDGDMPVGVVFQDVASGAPVKIVTSGTAYVLPDTGITAARGNVIYSSSTAAGLAQQAASVPADATHFKEIGHFVETGTANGALAKAIIHFN